MNKIALAIHGGAGTILKNDMSAELERDYRNGLRLALEEGWKILQKGGTSLDAVESAVVILENNPLFNAGKGSVFTHDEKNEMDAAIMCGKTLEAGAVAFVKNIKNPIKLARLVMEKTEHILLAGSGANDFAKEFDVDVKPDEYFFTEHRFEQLKHAKKSGKIQLDHSAVSDKSKIGTVGAVACDKDGNVAAATSTGGMTNKNYGRVGDTAIIGAGTFADNQTCAVSCTGHGEYFMRAVTAHDVSARMKYKNLSLNQAAKEAIDYLSEIDGEGGLIAVDKFGSVALPFNSDGMYRGWIAAEGEIQLEIYK